MARTLEHTGRAVWHWRECQERRVLNWDRQEPKDPEDGDSWMDESTSSVYRWDGGEWVCVPSD
jgi:hypothetical protein